MGRAALRHISDALIQDERLQQPDAHRNSYTLFPVSSEHWERCRAGLFIPAACAPLDTAADKKRASAGIVNFAIP